MVRSPFKLIYCRDDAKSLFFDLRNDLPEMNNLYRDPQYQDEIKRYKEALCQMMLFDAPSPVFLDEDAAQTEASNVPEAGFVDRFEQWIREQMSRSLKRKEC